MTVYKDVRFRFKDPIDNTVKDLRDVAVCIWENYVYVVNMKMMEAIALKNIEERKIADIYKDTEYLKKEIEKEVDSLIRQCLISEEIKGKVLSINTAWEILPLTE